MRITIIGGGVVGLSSAVAMLADGHAVTIVNADRDCSAASWGDAGHIATEQTAPFASWSAIRAAPSRRFGRGGALDLPLAQWRHWLPFAARFIAASGSVRFAQGQKALAALLAAALPAWHELAAAIGERGLVKQDGHYIVWESAQSAAKGAAAWRTANTGSAVARSAEFSERARIARLTPAVAGEVIRFDGSAQIADRDRLARALEASVIAAGGRIARDVARLTLVDGRAAVAGHDADLVLVAAGARSARIVAAAGLRVPLIAERGYHIRADADDAWPIDMPPIVFEDRSMIVTRYADSVQASGFVEFGAADAAPDPRKWERLEAHVRDLGLPLQPPFTRWMGARPTLPDYLPAIGRSRRFGNLLYAFGHQHLGLTLAPMTATILTALARDEQPAIDIASFAIERFGVR